MIVTNFSVFAFITNDAGSKLSYQHIFLHWRRLVIKVFLSFEEFFTEIETELTSDALVMLVATELSVGDIADEATSDGLAVMLLKRCWNMNGKLLLEPAWPDE